MPTLTLIGISNVTGIQMMVSLGREKQVLYSEIAGAIVDLVLNTIFIPIYGAAGAALGTLVAEAVVLGWQCVAIRDLKMGIFQKLPYGKILVAVGLGSVASFWVKLLGIGVFPTLVISAVCFFGVYGIVMTVMKDSLILELEKQIVWKIQKKNRYCIYIKNRKDRKVLAIFGIIRYVTNHLTFNDNYISRSKQNTGIRCG